MEEGRDDSNHAAKKLRRQGPSTDESSEMEVEKGGTVAQDHHMRMNTSTGTHIVGHVVSTRNDYPTPKEAQMVSYKDKTMQGSGGSFTIQQNPVYQEVESEEDYETDDDIQPEADDPECPTITLTVADKKEFWKPWKNTPILKLFDKGPGYMTIKKKLIQKWGLSATFFLIDIGNEHYITRFANKEDYDHVLTQGPWMIGDNYLSIRKWVPRFNVKDDKISSLAVWIRIPWLHIEYFNQKLLYRIGSKVGNYLEWISQRRILKEVNS